MTASTSIEEFKARIQAEKDRLKNENEQRMKEQGLNPFLSFEQGNTRLKIMPDMPRDINTQYGIKKALNVEHAGAIKTILCNSMLYEDIINLVANGIYEIDVTRIGTGKETRYAVNQAK